MGTAWRIPTAGGATNGRNLLETKGGRNQGAIGTKWPNRSWPFNLGMGVVSCGECGENTTVPRDLVHFPHFPGVEAPGYCVGHSGAGFSDVARHSITSKLALTHTLERRGRKPEKPRKIDDPRSRAAFRS